MTEGGDPSQVPLHLGGDLLQVLQAWGEGGSDARATANTHRHTQQIDGKSAVTAIMASSCSSHSAAMAFLAARSSNM